MLYFGGKYITTCITATTDGYSVHDGVLDSQVMEFRGAFIACTTSTHVFELWSQTYSLSALSGIAPSEVRFEFEDVNRGQASGSWTWSPGTLYQDYQYHMKSIVHDNYFFVDIAILVSYDGNDMGYCTGDLIAACERNGCRDDANSRSHDCQPSPTQSRTPTCSHSPTPTKSRTLTPTKSHTPTPTCNRSPNPSFTATTVFQPTKVLVKPAAITVSKLDRQQHP
jgi:hypothetical protein